MATWLRRAGQQMGISKIAALKAYPVDRCYTVVPRFQPDAGSRKPADRRLQVQIKGHPVTQAAKGHGHSQPDQHQGIRPARSQGGVILVYRVVARACVARFRRIIGVRKWASGGQFRVVLSNRMLYEV